MNNKILTLRMERQHLIKKADESEYIGLYRDLQPGYNVYWNGFGDPPSLTYRADFDDIEFNRKRQSERLLLKGRFAGGNLGWIMSDDNEFELFACAFIKPIDKMTKRQMDLYNLIDHEGPMTIQQMKETTGLLVKEITPALHRLQEAFMIYEDQYDGEWDRGWYRFDDMFPDINLKKYTKTEALKILIQRFAYRHVLFDADMVKSFYKLSVKDTKAAIDLLDTIVPVDGGYMLKTDVGILENYTESMPKKVYAIHKNDFLYRSNEHTLKDKYKRDGIETIYYVLIDGEFKGAAYGKFRYGPPDFDDLYIDHPESDSRKDEIIEAVKILSYGKSPDKYNGITL